jgi:hypothetical protein
MEPERSGQQGGGEASGASIGPEPIINNSAASRPLSSSGGSTTTTKPSNTTKSSVSFRPKTENSSGLDIKIVHTNIRTGMSISILS